MRTLSACLVAGILGAAPASALAGPDHPDPWQRAERFEHSTSQGRLGVMVMSMTSDLRHYFGAPNERGVLVAKVEPGSPAASAGIQVGDVIVNVRGEGVDDAGDIISALSDVKRGDKINVQLVRDKKQLGLDATMGTGNASLQSLQWLRQAIPWFDFDALKHRSSTVGGSSST